MSWVHVAADICPLLCTSGPTKKTSTLTYLSSDSITIVSSPFLAIFGCIVPRLHMHYREVIVISLLSTVLIHFGSHEGKFLFLLSEKRHSGILLFTVETVRLPSKQTNNKAGLRALHHLLKNKQTKKTPKWHA